MPVKLILFHYLSKHKTSLENYFSISVVDFMFVPSVSLLIYDSSNCAGSTVQCFKIAQR